MTIRASMIAAVVLAAAASAAPAARQARAPQQPAFDRQTKAPAPSQASQYSVDTVASGLAHPWAMAFLPNGHVLVTERAGQIRIVDGARVSEPLQGLPPVRAVSAEGLHDIVIDPAFASNRLVYFTYFAPPPGQPGGPQPNTAFTTWIMQPPAERARHPLGVEQVASARLSDDERTLEHVKVLRDVGDRRLAFAPDGTLFVTASAQVGGGNVPIDDLPQRLDNIYGKVLRINRDGSIPKDNPFRSKAGARPEIYALGLRDPEGATIEPGTGRLWTVEHGVKGGDELNLVRPGSNEGFPIIAYGLTYASEPIGAGLTAKDGLEQPVYYWDPDIGPSGMSFYSGALMPDWKGNLFIGALPGKHVVRLVMKNDRVVYEEWLLADQNHRIRDVRQGPDGALYLLTDEDNGLLLRVGPKR